VPSEAIRLLAPEITLAVAAVGIYMLGAFVTAGHVTRWLAGGAIALAAAILALQSPSGPVGPLAGDRLGLMVRWLGLALGFALVLMACRAPRRGAPEFFGSLLLAVAGVMLSAAAGELVLLYVALELVAIPTYLLLFLSRSDVAAEEATTKYFFLSVLSSVLLLYGLSFVYGAAGSTELAVVAQRLAETPAGTQDLTRLAIVLVAAGLGLKIAAVPFHFYAPDVYEGTTHWAAAFLSVVPKTAGLAALVRLLAALPGAEGFAWRLVAVLAVASLVLANTMALAQENLRRLMAYSSIAHTGFLLLGVAAGVAAGGSAGTWNGRGGMLFYLCVYFLGTLGVLAAFAHLARDGRTVDNIDDLAGLGRSEPAVAAALAVCLFSLTGIPPLAGFWGKLAVLAAALDVSSPDARPWFVALAVTGVLAAAVAAAYYLRVVGALYFRMPLAVVSPPRRGGAWAAAMGCALLSVVLGLWSGPLLGAADRAGSAVWSNPIEVHPSTVPAE